MGSSGHAFRGGSHAPKYDEPLKAARAETKKLGANGQPAKTDVGKLENSERKRGDETYHINAANTLMGFEEAHRTSRFSIEGWSFWPKGPGGH